MRELHTLQRGQAVPAPIAQVFAFFADADNLDVITPRWMRFRIATPSPIRLAEGTRIEYRLAWHGLPPRWIAEIVEWDPPYGFTGVQRKGPYSVWPHTHRFEPRPGRTRMEDIVQSALPLGPLGRAAQRFFVRREVQRIFDCRAERIRALVAGEGPHAVD